MDPFDEIDRLLAEYLEEDDPPYDPSIFDAEK